MSTRSGEQHRNRSQKHQNLTKWNAYNKFKTDPKSKIASSVTVTNCCLKCTGVIEWKIKYGKYKPLTQPAKCTRCLEKRIKSAYHILCQPCVEETKNCAQKRLFLDVHATFAILHSRYITCHEEQNRLVPSRIFVKIDLESQAKAKFSSRISKFCHY